MELLSLFRSFVRSNVANTRPIDRNRCLDLLPHPARAS